MRCFHQIIIYCLADGASEKDARSSTVHTNLSSQAPVQEHWRPVVERTNGVMPYPITRVIRFKFFRYFKSYPDTGYGLTLGRPARGSSHHRRSSRSTSTSPQGRIPSRPGSARSIGFAREEPQRCLDFAFQACAHTRGISHTAIISGRS